MFNKKKLLLSISLIFITENPINSLPPCETNSYTAWLNTVIPSNYDRKTIPPQIPDSNSINNRFPVNVIIRLGKRSYTEHREYFDQ